MNRDSIKFTLDGIDGTKPQYVARKDLVEVFASMAESDLIMTHADLYKTLPHSIDNFNYYTDMPAKQVIELLEQHMRAVNALRALLSLRDPDELVEAHLP